MPVERTAYTNAPSNRRSLANTACQRSVGLMAEKLVRAPTEFYPICALKSSMPRLVFGRTIDGRHLASGHTEIHGELATVMDLVIQEKPEDIEPPHVALLLRAGHEFHGCIELALIGLADLVGNYFQRLLDFADHSLPRAGLCRHVRGREFHFALGSLGARHSFKHERPGKILGAAAGVVRFQLLFASGIGAQHLERGR